MTVRRADMLWRTIGAGICAVCVGLYAGSMLLGLGILWGLYALRPDYKE
jgi:hypothetical protein